MPKEKQVCSLELSQKLKELEVKQKSYFYWRDDGFTLTDKKEDYHPDFKWYSAFTVAELGEMLPKEINGYYLKIHYMQGLVAWRIHYVKPNGSDAFHEDATTEADARAAMLVYLIENSLISV
jgi:hypothetical protein